jgi:cell wall integrity and stress response component
MQRLQYSLL